MDSGDETESIQLINNNFNCHDNKQNNNTNNLNEEVKINIKDLKKDNNNDNNNDDDDDDDEENDEMENLYKAFQNKQHQGSIRSTGTSTDFIELIWSNLTYSIVKTSYSLKWLKLKMERNQQQVNILKNLNGKFESNKLTAIMGPSGAGKTTLMECLAGRRQLGLTGKIMVNKFGINNKIKIAYNSQNETLLKALTVKETLLFASKICNLEQNNFDMNYFYDYNSNFEDNQPEEESKGSKEVVEYKQLKKDGKIRSLHQLMVENLMKNLGLDLCADVRISNCSGGQLKRVSIALELITSPSILLLDEPTSGLDSVSCLSCINLLKNLSKQARPLIIAASIHQPTAKLLSYFDHLYMISYTGQCIYSGPPSKLVEHMLAFDYPCPQYHNPADFITEIANGDHGHEIINKLDESVKDQDNKYSFKKKNNHFSGSVKLSKILRKSHVHKKKYQYTLFKTLLERSLKITAREPIVSYLRLFATLIILVLISFLYMDNQVGLVSGCFEFPSLETIIEKIRPRKVLSTSTLGGNVGLMFFSLTFIGIAASVPVCFTFPIEIDVIKKERTNGWYSVGTYFLAKTVAEFPFTITFALIYGILVYYLTSQINDYWRLVMFNVILVILSFCCQSMGMFVSSFYANKIVAASFTTAIYNIPLFLFAGMFVRVSTMASFIQPLTLLSYFRLSFESLLIVIYGFDRCPPPEQVSLPLIKEKFSSNGYDFVSLTNCLDELDVDIMINASAMLNDINRINAGKTGSLILKGFDLNETDLYFDLTLLFLYSILMQLGAYFVLLWKFNKKK